MSSNFDIANIFTRAAEGGLSDHPADRGGITNHGVSIRFLRNVAGASQANRDRLHRMGIRLPVTREVIKSPPPDQATGLFRWQFWDLLHLDDIPLRMACLLYDAAVNHGRATSVRLAQRGFNASIVHGVSLVEDGILGPLTRRALSTSDTPAVHEAILEKRRVYYEAIVANDATQAVNFPGWMNRIFNLREYVRGL